LDGTNLVDEGETPATEVTVTGVRSAHIRMGDGNDLVGIAGASFRGHVAISTGAGEDRVLIGTGGDATELAGQLPEDLAVEIRGSLAINAGDDNDEISVDDATVGRLAVRAGTGDDAVSLGSDEAAEESEARLQVRGGVHVSLGDGNDSLALEQVRARHGVLVRGGAGDDTVDATTVGGHVVAVVDGEGDDDVTLNDLEVRHLHVATGVGTDTVDVRDSAFGTFGVALGDGDDSLTTSALEARVAIMLGGEGEDTLNIVDPSDFSHQVIRAFEIPADVNTGELGRRPLARRGVGRFR
jgi:hypothetical protein